MYSYKLNQTSYSRNHMTNCFLQLFLGLSLFVVIASANPVEEMEEESDVGTFESLDDMETAESRHKKVGAYRARAAPRAMGSKKIGKKHC